MIKRQSSIMDKDKLFRKIFISPSYSSAVEPPVLVSPDFIILLLEESAQTPKDEQIDLIKEILDIFVVRPTNSLLLNHTDRMFRRQIEKSIMDSIVMRVLALVETEEQVELYLQKISLMLAYYRVSLKNINKLTQWLSKATHQEKFNPIKLMFIIRLFKIYFGQKLGVKGSPESYFYLLGSENCTIHPVQHSNSQQMTIKNELSLTMVFNSQGSPDPFLNVDASSSYNLFHMKTERKEEIGISFRNGKIKIIALAGGRFLDQLTIFEDLSEQKWYRLVVNFTHVSTECELDGVEKKFRSLLKKEKDHKIKSCLFGKQFFGMLGSVILANKVWPFEKFPYEEFRFGIQNWNSLIALNKTGLPSSVILSCLPFSTFEVRNYLHCFDVFRRNHSAIGQNIYILSEPISQDGIRTYGGFTVIIPLFYLARFYKAEQYPYLLEDLLQLLLELFNIFDPSQIDFCIHSEDFLQIIGQHLQDIPYLHSLKTMRLLDQIYKKILNEDSKIIFIRHVLWNLNLSAYSQMQTKAEPPAKMEEQIEDLIRASKSSRSPRKKPSYQEAEQELVRRFYTMLIKIYENDRATALKAFNFQQIAYWMVHHLETPLGMMFSCCLQHYVNQSVLAHQLQLEEVAKLHSRKVKEHYGYLEMILANILESAIIAKKRGEAVDLMKTLLRLLLQKYSACLYMCVLRVIRKQVDKFRSGPEIISVLSDEKLELISFMVFLSEKTINPDIISNITFLTFFMATHCEKVKKRDEYIQFAVHLFKIGKDFTLMNQVNPIIKGVQRIRKNTISYTSRQACKARRRAASFDIRNLNWGKGRKLKVLHSEATRAVIEAIKQCPRHERLSEWTPLFNLVINFLSGVVSEDEPRQDAIICNSNGLMVLREYYCVCSTDLKQKVLLYILLALERHPSVRESSSLNIFLLENLTRDYSAAQSCSSSTLAAIYSCIFSSVISNRENISNYYSSLKCIKPAKSAISCMLIQVIPKVIKLMDMGQLCQLLSICYYEAIESSYGEVIGLAHSVITHLHEQIRNYLCTQMAIPKDHQFTQLPKLIVREQNQQAMRKVKQLELFATLEPIQSDKLIHTKKSCEFAEILREIYSQLQKQKRLADILTVMSLDVFGISSDLPLGDTQMESEPKIVEIDEKEQMEDMKEISKDKKLLKNGLQQQTQHNLKTQNIELSFFQIYLLFVHRISVSTAQPAEVARLRQDSLAAMKLYCIGATLPAQSTEEREVQLLMTYFFMYKIYQREQDIGSILELWKFILMEIVCTNSEQEGYMIRKKSATEGTHNHIFQEISQNYLNICRGKDLFELTRDNTEQNISNQVQNLKVNGRILSIMRKLDRIFCSMEDQIELLVVERYQSTIQTFVSDYEALMSYTMGSSFRNIQKLFDKENAEEEKARIKFLYMSECEFRKYHAQWDRIWNKLRTYHHSYGFWMAQKNTEGVFVYAPNQIRNFKFQMSDYSSQSGINPVLEAKVIQPWHAVKDNQAKKNKYINSFSEMMRPSLIQQTEQSQQNGRLSGLWKSMLPKRIIMQDRIREYDAVWISRSNKAEGKLFIQNKEDLIFCYDSVRQDDSHISFEKFSLPYNRETYNKWSIFKIVKVRVHRYMMKYTALELKMSDGRSLIFDFTKGDKQNFIKELEKIQKQKIQTHNHKLYKLNKIAFFGEKALDTTTLVDARVMESWRKGEMSNLSYLMYLNGVASRGILDMSQYCVFPWISELKNEKQPQLRDLSKTMGGLGSKDRQQILKEKFMSHDSFNPHPPFFFGTHYSSPGVVFNFLIRISPFTEYCRHLQGGKFDIADRLFCSLVNAWRSATEEVSDVRELIPQFYYLPQALINIDQHNFGTTQNGQKINHVDIPSWSAHNPYFFTSQMRIMLESEKVSRCINDWIDLIFGYKQKGKQAEENFNIYYYLTYEEYANLSDDSDDDDGVYRKSKESQIAHFGQVPPMIFDKPHPRRYQSRYANMPELDFVRKIKLINSLKEKPIGVKVSNNELTIVKRQEVEIFSLQSNPASLQKKKKLNIQKSSSEIYYLLKKENSHAQFIGKTQILVWGYLNHQIRVYSKSTGEIVESDQLESKILAVFVNKEETIILVGLACGLLVVYEIERGSNDFFLKRIGSEAFPSEISHIQEYDGFYSVAFGNYVAIYKIQRTLHYISSANKTTPSYNKIKFFRSFYNPLPVKAAFIMSSPLFSLVIIDNANIRTFSINGQLIRSVFSNAGNHRVYGRFKDHQGHDIFYSVQEERIICYSMPDLRSVSILELPQDCEFVGEEYLIPNNNRDEIWKFDYVDKEE